MARPKVIVKCGLNKSCDITGRQIQEKRSACCSREVQCVPAAPPSLCCIPQRSYIELAPCPYAVARCTMVQGNLQYKVLKAVPCRPEAASCQVVCSAPCPGCG